MTQPYRIRSLAQAIIDKAGPEGVTIATAESCTGGLVAAALTDVPGSSAVFERGFITYSNEAKSELLGVSADLIKAHGAVSAEVAGAMAVGALRNSRANIAVSVTGIAGPDGGSPDKPVGLVWFGLAARSGGQPEVEKKIFTGWGWPTALFRSKRHYVRQRAVETALRLLLAATGAAQP